MGLVLMVVVHSAGIEDRDGAKDLFEKAKKVFPKMKHVWADGGYAGKLVDFVSKTFDWVLEIVRRDANQEGFKLLKRRWVVERTFGWMIFWRRTAKDWEHDPKTSETVVYLTMIHLMLRRLA